MYRNKFHIHFAICFCTIWLTGNVVAAQSAKQKQSDYYKIVSLPIPKGVVLEVGDIQKLSDGKVAVSSRRGEIYLIENAFSPNPQDAKFTRYAQGLHEVLGLAEKDGWLYATQRCELTRMKDTTGDGRADIFRTVNDDWGITGNYHEYAFGSKPDKDGNIWITLCLTGSFSSDTAYRGWCVRITPQGKMIPTCSGLRSPGGIGANIAGDMFFTDNQGPWNGTCGLKWLRPKSFQGHPGGNKWYSLATKAMGPQPQEPKSGSRIMIEAKKIPQFEPPAVLFPYKKMGQSASGVACDISGGKFGSFQGQMFVGDQTHSTIMRVSLEKVQGHYQGACFPFLEGFQSGNLAVELTDDGSLFVGGTNRGWGSRGTKPFALERVVWTGKIPFEIHEMHAIPDGFEFTFTRPVDRKTATNAASYRVSTYTYIYQSSYGSPEVDHTTPKITRIECDRSGRKVRLYLDKVQEGHVHEFHLDGVMSQNHHPLLHKEAYYTLNYFPKK